VTASPSPAILCLVVQITPIWGALRFAELILVKSLDRRR